MNDRTQRQRPDGNCIQGNSVKQLDKPEGHAGRTLHRVEANGRQKYTQRGRNNALAEGFPGQPGNQGEGEDYDGGKFRRTKLQGERRKGSRHQNQDDVRNSIAENG